MKKAILYITIIFITSCVRSNFKEITVSSLSEPSNIVSKYNYCYIDTKYDRIDKRTLSYKNYKSYIDMALKNNGIKTTNIKSKSNCIIFIDYGVSEPDEKMYLSSDYGDTSSISTRYIVNYFKHLTMDARKTNGEQLWIVDARTAGASGELSESFPYLLSVASQKIKKVSNNSEQFIMRDNDPNVIRYSTIPENDEFTSDKAEKYSVNYEESSVTGQLSYMWKSIKKIFCGN
ncbi:MAG: hypothetical protein R3Y43_08440 [Alphaproteobacteria bacterium]